MADDTIPPGHFFGRAVLRFGTALEPLGYRLVGQRYDEAAFGSAYAEYGRALPSVRLVWDGKDEALRADISTPEGGGWVDVEAMASGRAPALERRRDDARLDTLAAAVQAAVKSRRAGR